MKVFLNDKSNVRKTTDDRRELQRRLGATLRRVLADPNERQECLSFGVSFLHRTFWRGEIYKIPGVVDQRALKTYAKIQFKIVSELPGHETIGLASGVSSILFFNFRSLFSGYES